MNRKPRSRNKIIIDRQPSTPPGLTQPGHAWHIERDGEPCGGGWSAGPIERAKEAAQAYKDRLDRQDAGMAGFFDRMIPERVA